MTCRVRSRYGHINHRGRNKNSQATKLSTVTKVTCRSGGDVGAYATLANAGVASAAQWERAASAEPPAINQNGIAFRDAEVRAKNQYRMGTTGVRGTGLKSRRSLASTIL